MDEYERKQLLERIERDGATIGTELPESVDIDGEVLDLRAFVFETRRQETIPPDERDRVDRLKRQLRAERTARADRLESADITREEGETLAESIVGIDRALEALETLDPGDVESDRQAARMADRKRWLQFLRSALGQDDETGDRRARGET